MPKLETEKERSLKPDSLASLVIPASLHGQKSFTDPVRDALDRHDRQRDGLPDHSHYFYESRFAVVSFARLLCEPATSGGGNYYGNVWPVPVHRRADPWGTFGCLWPQKTFDARLPPARHL